MTTYLHERVARKLCLEDGFNPDSLVHFNPAWTDYVVPAAAVIPMILEEAAKAQPSTAEDPNESVYQRGRFDGIMEFAAAIRTLGQPK